MGQSNKPPTIVWATSGTAIIQTPPGPKILDGWVAGDIPPDGQVNWFWNGVSRAADYAVDLVAQASDSYVTAGLAVTPTGPPSSTSIQVAIGTAIVDGQEVELTVAETVPMGITAGAAAADSVRPVLISIDGTGTIITDGYGVFDSDAAGLREVFTRMPDPSPQEARLAVVLVRESVQTVFDVADIISVQQTQPISGGVIQDRSIRGISHLVPPLVMVLSEFSNQTQFDKLTVSLQTKEGDPYPSGPAMPVDAEIVIELRLYTETEVNSSDYPSFVSTGTINVEFLTGGRSTSTDAASRVIEVKQNNTRLLTDTSYPGALWLWRGKVPLIEPVVPPNENEIDIILHKRPGSSNPVVPPPDGKYLISISTNLGPTSFITFDT